MENLIPVEILLVTALDEKVYIIVKIHIGTANYRKIPHQLAQMGGMVDEIHIQVPFLEPELVSQGKIIHKLAPFPLKHVDGIQRLERAELAGPVQIVAHQGVLVERAVVQVRGCAHLCNNRMIAVAGVVRA